MIQDLINPVNIRKYILTAVLVLSSAAMMVACSKKPEVTEETELTTETTVETTAATPTPTPTPMPVFPKFDYEYKVSAPVIEEAEEGSRTRYVTFYRDGNPISGKLTVPEGEGPFKTIIISSGLYAHLGRYSGKAQRYCDNGYAVIEFFFQNGSPPAGYADPDYLGDFIYEQVLDLYSIIDSTVFIPEIDRSNIYLYGHSMGGLVCTYAGVMRQMEIKGLLLVDPSFYAVDRMNFENGETISTDIYPMLAQCYIPAVIITGTEGSFGEDPNFFDEARAAFPYCDYVVIDGADHHMDGDASDKVVDASIEAMKTWEAGT